MKISAVAQVLHFLQLLSVSFESPVLVLFLPDSPFFPSPSFHFTASYWLCSKDQTAGSDPSSADQLHDHCDPYLFPVVQYIAW